MRCSKKRESILEIIKDIYHYPAVDSIYPQARLVNLQTKLKKGKKSC